MAEPTTPTPTTAAPVTPGEERRMGLRRARWVAVGASVGAAAFLTGAIAAVNAAPSKSTDSDSSTEVQTRNGIGDEEFGSAEPFSPQSQTSVPSQNDVQATPQVEQPQTSSHGS